MQAPRKYNNTQKSTNSNAHTSTNLANIYEESVILETFRSKHQQKKKEEDDQLKQLSVAATVHVDPAPH